MTKILLPPIGSQYGLSQNDSGQKLTELLAPVSLARQIYQQKRRNKISPRPLSSDAFEPASPPGNLKSSKNSAESLISLANSVSSITKPAGMSSASELFGDEDESLLQMKKSLDVASKVKVRQSREIARMHREMTSMRQHLAELQVKSNKEIEQLKLEKAHALLQAQHREQLIQRQRDDMETRVRDLEATVANLKLELKREQRAFQALDMHSRKIKQYQEENSRLKKVVQSYKFRPALTTTLAQSRSNSNQTLAASNQSLKSQPSSASDGSKASRVEKLEKECENYVKTIKELKKRLKQFATANLELAKTVQES